VVYKRIIRVQRKFLWGWGKENRTIAWVSWQKICKPKEEGGLRMCVGLIMLYWQNGSDVFKGMKQGSGKKC